MLATGPAVAAVTATTLGTVVFIDGDAASDNITVTCAGGNVTVNASPAAPALDCTAATAMDIEPADGIDTIRAACRAPPSPP